MQMWIVMDAGKAEGDTGQAPQLQLQLEQPQWRRDCDYFGKVRVLQWAGLSRTNAQWPKRWAAVYRGYIYLLASEDATAAITTCNFWNDRYFVPSFALCSLGQMMGRCQVRCTDGLRRAQVC
jgi:hypothetical protein